MENKGLIFFFFFSVEEVTEVKLKGGEKALVSKTKEKAGDLLFTFHSYPSLSFTIWKYSFSGSSRASQI